MQIDLKQRMVKSALSTLIPMVADNKDVINNFGTELINGIQLREGETDSGYLLFKKDDRAMAAAVVFDSDNRLIRMEEPHDLYELIEKIIKSFN